MFFLIFFEYTFDFDLPLFGDFKRKHVGHILSSKAGSSGIQIPNKLWNIFTGFKQFPKSILLK